MRPISRLAVSLAALAVTSRVTSHAATAQQRAAAPASDSAVARNLRAEQRDDPKFAPNRHEGEGPFPRLILRGAILIDGTGAPPHGPVDIVVEGNRITEVRDVGVPHVAIDSTRRPKGPAREIDVFEKVFRNRAAVYGDEWPVFSPAVEMNGFGQ